MSPEAILMATLGAVVLIATVIVFWKVDRPRMRRERDELSKIIHDAAMGKPSGEAVFMSDLTECDRLAAAILAAGYRKHTTTTKEQG